MISDLYAIAVLIALGGFWAYWGSFWWAILGALFWPIALGYVLVARGVCQ